ncbi:B3 domain-containing protein REM16 [Bienertia sinuspersici]
MEKNKNLGKSRTWEEQIYWKHFHSIHFLQILPTSFHHHLTLPTKFTANEMTNLPENAILKGPNGTIWHVSLLNDDSNHVMLSGDGWKEFVKAYSLLKNDLLMFKYDKTNKCFEVLIFDRASSCEREASYFVKMCGLSQSNAVEMERRRVCCCMIMLSVLLIALMNLMVKHRTKMNVGN